MSDTRVRRAETRASAPAVEPYLPSNYFVARTGTGGVTVILGVDEAGWTLDDYVIPRLASGLITATETGVVTDHCGNDNPHRPHDMGDGRVMCSGTTLDEYQLAEAFEAELGTPEPKPFSAAFELLYDEYREIGYGSWESWLKARLPVECGDCGDRLALPAARRSWVHLDDGTPACTSRSEANARRIRQGRPAVGR